MAVKIHIEDIEHLFSGPVCIETPNKSIAKVIDSKELHKYAHYVVVHISANADYPVLTIREE